MVNFIQNFIGDDYWATVIMSFIPLIELKGAIVFARGAGIGFAVALFLAYAGSTAVFFPIYWLLKPVLGWMKKIKRFKSFAQKCEKYVCEKANKAVEKRKGKNTADGGKFFRQLGVFIFVAIPLPMTGVWTGTAIAVFLNLSFRDAVIPVAAGNLVAGLLISLLAEVCSALWTIKVLDYILYALFVIAIIMLVVMIIKVLSKKTRDDGDNK